MVADRILVDTEADIAPLNLNFEPTKVLTEEDMEDKEASNAA